MSIRQLLYVAFGFIFLAAGLITFWQLNTVRAQLGKIETAGQAFVEVAAPLQNATQELEINAGEMVGAAMTYVTSHDPEEKELVGDAGRISRISTTATRRPTSWDMPNWPRPPSRKSSANNCSPSTKPCRRRRRRS